MIVAENLVYHIQGRRLTDDVSVTLPDGEIIAILGPNGAGKSTLLRQLTGYLQPHSGRCSLFGKPLNEWSITELAKTRAVMRQNSHMAFPFSVQEVIRMGRHPYRTRNTGDETEHIMTLCDCQALAARDYRHLSGGEQQRVQLARLLVQLWEPEPRPKWLFLDEPTSALDIHHQQHLFRLLRRLVGEYTPKLGRKEYSGTIIPITRENYRLASCCTGKNCLDNCIKKISNPLFEQFPILGFMNIEHNTLLGGVEYIPSTFVPYDIPVDKTTAFITCIYLSDTKYDYKTPCLRVLEKYLSNEYNRILVVSDETGVFPNGDLKFFKENGYDDLGILSSEENYCTLHLMSKYIN